MTINEAIVHAREVAEEQKRRSGECVTNDKECDKFSTCIKCAEEHEQLAEWLEELKAIKDGGIPIIRGREELKFHDREIRNKAIDECIKILDTKEPKYHDVLNDRYDMIERLRELKRCNR